MDVVRERYKQTTSFSPPSAREGWYSLDYASPFYCVTTTQFFSSIIQIYASDSAHVERYFLALIYSSKRDAGRDSLADGQGRALALAALFSQEG